MFPEYKNLSIDMQSKYEGYVCPLPLKTISIINIMFV